MANKLGIFGVLCMILTATSPAAHSGALGSKAVDQWMERLPLAKQKVTKLHFYYHDTIDGGENPTALKIAKSDITNKSRTEFGSLRMMDDPLTVGPDPNSTTIGRAQGIYGSASLTEVGALLMTFNLFFTQGKYNGSTLSVVGRNPMFNEYREMPIVGGSGVFRLARGIATAKTHSVNVTAKIGIVEFNVVVLHYD